MGYVLALPEAMCDILLKCLIHILKAHDISSWKIQEKVEIITNHILQFWTQIPKNGYCDISWVNKSQQIGHNKEKKCFILNLVL